MVLLVLGALWLCHVLMRESMINHFCLTEAMALQARPQSRAAAQKASNKNVVERSDEQWSEGFSISRHGVAAPQGMIASKTARHGQ